MSIASTLFSDSQSRLYVWLFGQPQRTFHLSELRRLTGLGSASLQREINRLADAGLVHSHAVGNLRQFQANPASPVFSELVSVVCKTLGVVPVLRDALQGLQPRLSAAWVYGSVAKQTETASSDIDLMLVGDNLRLGEVLEALEPARGTLARDIQPTLYTQAEFSQRAAEPDSFVQRVLAQPTLPILGAPHGIG